MAIIVQRHILYDNYFFSNVTLIKENVHIILGPIEIIIGFGNATIILPIGITFIEDALLNSRLKRNLLSFRDVLRNGYHLETLNEQNKECLYITSHKMGLKTINEMRKLSLWVCILSLYKLYNLMLHVLKISKHR